MTTQVASIKWLPSASDRRFIVDGFNFQSPSCRSYFLTHYHSDHTTGLSKSFRSGTIYTSEVTARLLIHDMGINPKVVCPLPLHTPIAIEGCKVTLLDANHCPGAVMLLVEVPHGGRTKVLLHTGDFRWADWMAGQIPAGMKVDEIFLDTTYCAPRNTFPPQQLVIQGLVNEVVQMGQGEQQQQVQHQELGRQQQQQGQQGCEMVQMAQRQPQTLGQQHVQQQQQHHDHHQYQHHQQEQHHPHPHQQQKQEQHHHQRQQQEQHHQEQQQHAVWQQHLQQQLEHSFEGAQTACVGRARNNSANWSTNNHSACDNSAVWSTTDRFLDNTPTPTSPCISPDTLVVVAAYRIGKERVFLSLAKALGVKVWCSPAKRHVLAQLGLPDSDLALFVDNPSQAQLHVVSWGIKPEALQTQYLKSQQPFPLHHSTKSSIDGAAHLPSQSSPVIHSIEDAIKGAAHLLPQSYPLHYSIKGSINGGELLPIGSGVRSRRCKFSGRCEHCERILECHGQGRMEGATNWDKVAEEVKECSEGAEREAEGEGGFDEEEDVFDEAAWSDVLVRGCKHGEPLWEGASEPTISADTLHLYLHQSGVTSHPPRQQTSSGAGTANDTAHTQHTHQQRASSCVGTASSAARAPHTPQHHLSNNTGSASDTAYTHHQQAGCNVGVGTSSSDASVIGRWKRVIGIRPTGWSYRPRARSLFPRWTRGDVTVLAAPYSEHSSFAELCACVKSLRPSKIIPTVNAATPAEARAIINRFAPFMDLSKDRSRLDMYLLPRRPSQQQQQQQQQQPHKSLNSCQQQLHTSMPVDERIRVAQQCHRADEQASERLLSTVDIQQQQRLWDELQAAKPKQLQESQVPSVLLLQGQQRREPVGHVHMQQQVQQLTGLHSLQEDHSGPTLVQQRGAQHDQSSPSLLHQSQQQQAWQCRIQHSRPSLDGHQQVADQQRRGLKRGSCESPLQPFSHAFGSDDERSRSDRGRGGAVSKGRGVSGQGSRKGTVGIPCGNINKSRTGGKNTGSGNKSGVGRNKIGGGSRCKNGNGGSNNGDSNSSKDKNGEKNDGESSNSSGHDNSEKNDGESSNSSGHDNSEVGNRGRGSCVYGTTGKRYGSSSTENSGSGIVRAKKQCSMHAFFSAAASSPGTPVKEPQLRGHHSGGLQAMEVIYVE